MFLSLSKLLDLAVAPLTWTLVLLLGAALFHRRPRAPWALGLAAVAVLVAPSLAPVANGIQRFAEAGAERTFRPEVVYDAAIVLAGQVDADASRESGETELQDAVDRVLRGLELWRAGRVRHLLVSGSPVELAPGEPSEAERLRDALVRWGVPAAAIVIEPRSRNTRENAIESARLVAAHGFRSLLLVTSAAHVPRALGCFRAVGLSPDVLPVDRRAGRGGSWLPRAGALAQSTKALHELAGRVVYRLAGYSR
ncbi:MULTISPECIES: YdcF family protein [unclassified Anaeromyxobacter]|uniref:YdcF family protein n=1 Tax=unclassified Anaeromyxobacter TaxID=2620896 RepID=UPI001F5AA93F|nr:MULTISPECIES: YdcF family protein [unclassified Anaeromyxobacter]